MYTGTDLHALQTYYQISRGAMYEVVSRNPDLRWHIERIANRMPLQIKRELLEAMTDARGKKILEDYYCLPPTDSTDSDIHCKILTYKDAVKPLPPIEWVIEPLFSVGSLSILVGHPGSMKTYVLLYAAMCVASGKEWLDYPTKKSTVLYLDEEAGERRLFSRIQEIKNGGNFPDDIPLICTSMEGFNFSSQEWFNQLRQIISQHKVGFMVIDSLVDVMVGIDENSAKETNLIIRDLGKLAKEMNCAIVAIHHKGKSGDYRGSTAIEGGVDLMFEVKKNKKDVKLEFAVIKSRDIDDGFTLTARPKFENGKFSMVNAGPILRTSQIHEDILEFIKNNPNSSVNTIMADLLTYPIYALGKPKNAEDGKKQAAKLRERIRSVVNDLVEREKISRTNRGGNGIEGFYSVVEQ